MDDLLRSSIQEEITLDDENPVIHRKVSSEKHIRLGIIGTGSRGRSLLKACGYLRPEIIDDYIEASKKDGKKYFIVILGFFRGGNDTLIALGHNRLLPRESTSFK